MRSVIKRNPASLASKSANPVLRIRKPRYLGLRIISAGVLILAAIIAIWKVTALEQFDRLEKWGELQAAAILSRHPFPLSGIKIETSYPETELEILAAAAIEFPVSVLDIDLEAVRERVAALETVDDARIYVTSDSVLRISTKSRHPVALWRRGDRLELVDADGNRVGSISSRVERVDLGLLAGEGAWAAIPESLEIFRAAKPIENEIRGLVRIGKRRWNLELKGRRKILLPENGAIEAVEKLILWDEAEKVLQKDFEFFDLRIAERPTVRLREPSPGEI